MFKNYFIISLLTVLFISCDNKIYKNGMVVSAKHEASKVGIDILKMGGNAFDAMIATDLALSVVYQMVKTEVLILEKKHLLILRQKCI